MRDLGHFQKARDVIVFAPTFRDFAVLIACASLALLTITAVTTLRDQSRQFEINERV